MSWQDWVLLPAAPYQRPTCAWTWGVSVHCIHWSMQFGCAACEEIIHVSAQPVTPSDGMTAATGASAFAYVRLTGQAVPTSMEPSTKPSISSVYAAQYFVMSGFCAFSRFTAASSCALVSSYG